MNDSQFFSTMASRGRPSALPRMLVPTEVADWLRISPSMAYRMMKRGDIPAVPVGSYLRVSEEDLLAWMKSQKDRKSQEERDADTIAALVREM